jgi:NAD(P) transhydrogenase subunit alpha
MTTPLLIALLADTAATPEDAAAKFIRLLTVFLLAMWVGFEVIMKVPQRLHTPLTSGSNAISGITAVGALVSAGAVATGFGFGNLLGLLAVVLAMVNVAGGFVVTWRMLQMFNPKKK